MQVTKKSFGEPSSTSNQESFLPLHAVSSTALPQTPWILRRNFKVERKTNQAWSFFEKFSNINLYKAEVLVLNNHGAQQCQQRVPCILNRFQDVARSNAVTNACLDLAMNFNNQFRRRQALHPIFVGGRHQKDAVDIVARVMDSYKVKLAA